VLATSVIVGIGSSMLAVTAGTTQFDQVRSNHRMMINRRH
jgi:hypothetical protein